MKILFITNFCPHYHIKPFEELSKRFDIEYLFLSRGDNYHNGLNTVNNLKFKHEYLIKSYLRPLKIYRKIKDGGYDIIIKCVTGGYASIYSYMIAKIYNCKFIFWSNIWHYGINFRSQTARIIHSFLIKRADALVTYGEHIDQFIIEKNPLINKNKIFHSYNVVDNDLFRKMPNIEEIEYIKRMYKIENKTILLFVGRMSQEKGLNYLFEAYYQLKNKYKDITLLIVGEIDSAEFKPGVEDIVFIGQVNNDQLYKYYILADILILPSITYKDQKETWGLVINEAMNCNCAVIATDAVGCAKSKLLVEGENALIVREKNSLELKKSIEILLNDRELLEKLKNNNLARIKDFDEKLFADGFEEAVNYAI